MSKKSNIVFVFKDNKYIEIPYSELADENGKRNEKYSDKYFIPLHGYLMEVSIEE